jgi:hypothetical protein
MAKTLKTEVKILHLVGGKRSSHAPSARIVEPTSGLAPSRGKGNLYILIELEADDLSRAGSLYRQLLNVIQETYYNARGNAVTSLTEALQAAHVLLQRYNQDAGTDIIAGATCLVVTSQEIISAQAGPTILAVSSDQGLQWFSPLNDEDFVALGEEEAPTIEIGQVPGHSGVVMVAMQSVWANYIEVPLMMEATAVARAQAVTDALAGIGFQANEDMTALVVTMTGPKTKQAAAVIPAAIPGAAEAAVAGDHIPEASEDWEAHHLHEDMAWEDVYDTPETSGKGKKAAAGAGLGALIGLGKRAPRPSVSSKSTKKKTKSKKQKPKRLPYVLGFILILVAGIALVTAGMWYYQGRQRVKNFSTYLNSAQVQLQAVDNATDPEQARALIKASQEQLRQAEQFFPDHPEVRKMQAQILEVQAEINKVVRLMAGFDLPLIQFNKPNSDPSTVFVNGLSVYVLDPGREVFERYLLDDATADRLADGTDNPRELINAGDVVEGRTVGKLSEAIWAPTEGNRTASGPLVMDHSIQLFGINEGLGPVNVALAENPSLQFVSGMYFYNGNLYLLDPNSNQLWRYRPSGANYMNPPEPYFPPETPVDLKSVIDVGIDGYVWLLYPNGSMLRFLSGAQEAFALEPVDPPLTHAVAMWMNLAEPPAGRIFIADAATNRVLVFDKEGKLLAQLTPLEPADALKDLKDIYVDEMTNTLYLLTKTALYQSPLPTIKPADEGTP